MVIIKYQNIYIYDKIFKANIIILIFVFMNYVKWI